MFENLFQIDFYKKIDELNNVDTNINISIDTKKKRTRLNKEQETYIDKSKTTEIHAELFLIKYMHEKLKESLLMDRLLYGDVFYNPYTKTIAVFGFSYYYYDELKKSELTIDAVTYSSVGFDLYKLNKKNNCFELKQENMELINVLNDSSLMCYYNYIGNIYLQKDLLRNYINKKLGSFSVNNVIQNQKKVFITKVNYKQESQTNKNSIYNPEKKINNDYRLHLAYKTDYHVKTINEKVFKKYNDDLYEDEMKTESLLDKTILKLKDEVYDEIIKEMNLNTDYKDTIELYLDYYRLFMIYLNEYGEISFYSFTNKKNIPPYIHNLFYLQTNVYEIFSKEDDVDYQKYCLQLLHAL